MLACEKSVRQAYTISTLGTVFPRGQFDQMQKYHLGVLSQQIEHDIHREPARLYQSTCRLPEHWRPTNLLVPYSAETVTPANEWSHAPSSAALWLPQKRAPLNHNGTPNKKAID